MEGVLLLLLIATIDVSFARVRIRLTTARVLDWNFGIGGLSGGGATSRLLPDYDEQQRNEIYDYLFKPKFGASLQILKVEIGGDTQSTEGTEASHMHVAGDENYQRGYEWEIMKQAKRRNPNIKLYSLSWGFPRFVTEGTNTPYTNTTIKYILSWINGAQLYHNLTIDCIGIRNERSWSREYILDLRRAIHNTGLSTLIVAADDCCTGKWAICDALVNDKELLAAIDFIGAPYPNSQTTSSCASLNKTLWASEVRVKIQRSGVTAKITTFN